MAIIPLLDHVLRQVARRYRLPAMTDMPVKAQKANPIAELAFAIEQARQALSRDKAPDPALQQAFTRALGRLIREAMNPECGDPGFQAMVLRQRSPSVREYASLSAQARQDSRRVLARVNAIAHPGKLKQFPDSARRHALAELHAHATSFSWSKFAGAAKALQAKLGADDASVHSALGQLLESPALKNLLRLEALGTDQNVIQYLTLLSRNGPASGSVAAAEQGSESRKRGAAVEALAADALNALARRLNEADEAASYRVVTSMRVPSSIPADHTRAKTEWDAVLLARSKADAVDNEGDWDVCLLVEAKASPDAAATDLPRLLRGIRVLAQADARAVYSFKTKQGDVRLRGASLHGLSGEEAQLKKTVLYCSDAPTEPAPRLLGAASRMQLLSAPASLEYACALAQDPDAAPPAQDLEPVWRNLLELHQWGAVLHQYATLRQARDLMVHVDDLLGTVNHAPVV